MSPKAWFCLPLLLLLAAARPVAATDNHLYKADEYAIVSDGLSPDGHWSVAAHGGGEAGYDDFDLYLMREPEHAKVAPLRIDGALDTGPLSLVAKWSPDSAHLAVLNRIDRHVLQLSLFTVADGKLRPVKLPELVELVGVKHPPLGESDRLFSRLFRLTWERPGRLALQELDYWDSTKPLFSARQKGYLTVDRRGPERTFTTFSAEALLQITAEGKLRVLTQTPLPLSKWPKTIVYSPHLLFDPERGLYDTETSMSSLGVPPKQP